ncbi:hypothetical protein [Curtobacterium sp. MCBD17_040]|uniref:hypothetical protein n=1 Tax=Curtobacterium sp. MCBD17_040 TaxID=2175674 RepID=UPI0011B50DF7|nr:hypothetical protein [Curtobacterium sp. MCBD17_040]WIB65431.1 hypothetical protein DEI94_18670 [Curtobacterium sp. MCBD17_040]
MRRSSTFSTAVGALVTAVVIVGICVGIPAIFWGPQMVHGFARWFTADAFVLIPLLVMAVLLAATFIVRGAAAGIAGTFLGLALVGTIIFAWVPHNYQVDRLYLGDVKTVNHTAPSFGERTPFKVADTSSTKNLGNTTGTALNVKSLNDQAKNGLWDALVQRRGFGAGYESVQSQDIPLYGEATPSDVTTCNFSRSAKLRIGGGLWSNSLGRHIDELTPPTVTFTKGDVYGFCDGSTAKVVVPLSRIEGFWNTSETFYGDAVYNGSTGQLSIVTAAHTITALPGPVYPQSLAARQRAALRALGSFSDYWFNRAGYDDTSSDSGNPDAFNPTELGLRQTSTGHATYVTPLTPPGSSNSVVALSVVDASVGTHGTRNPITVFKYDKKHARQANSSVASEVRQSSSWLTGWASGLKVFEIVPGRKNEWVASIGQSQGVVYRAVIDENGKSTLFDEDGNIVTSTGTQAAGSSGNASSNDSSIGDTSSAGGDLSKMTPAQLQALANRITEELTKRAASASAPTNSVAPSSTATPRK